MRLPIGLPIDARRGARHFFPALTAALLLAACATPGDSQPRLAVQDGAALTEQPLWQAAAPAGQVAGQIAGQITDHWWQRLGDTQLDRLIERSLQDSPSVQLAAARLDKARALAAVSDAAGQPNVSARLDLSRQRFTENGLVPPPLAGTFASRNEGALDFSYELDVWGRQRASLDAALSQVEAARADSATASLLLAAGIARSYVQLDRAYLLRDIATATGEQRQQQFALTERRVAAGLEARSEALNSEAALSAARQEITALDEQISLLRHQLATLVGQGPAFAASIERPRLQPAALTLPTVLPADLLGRRPDLVASRWRVEAARRDSEAARAQFYPNINLVGLVGLSSIGMGQFFSAGSAITGIGPAIRLPLFDGGRLRGNLAGRHADADIAVAQYNQTLLDAVREVADQLSSWQAIASQQRDAERGLALAADSRQLAQLRAKAGLTNQLTALGADSAWLERRRVVADLKARALDAEISLVRALGGAYAAPESTTISSPVARSPQ